MCGINGIIYKNISPNFNEILKMNAMIRHRGPDDEGIYSFENAVLGHVRLSILDLTSKGKQPMSNDGNFWITYNGEIYNFQEIKSDLIKLKYKFFSNTDTEVVLNAFKEWGIEAFKKFNGMWSFAILDQKEKKIIISRDRYGVKPCYYFENENKIIFSSEIKGILASDENLKIDSNKILLRDKTKEKYCLTNFKSLNILQPGWVYEISLKDYSTKKTRWWNGLDNIPNISIQKSNIENEVTDLLYKATERRLISDVKIAISLSGGVDSSIIFSILNNLNSKSKIDLNPFIVNYEQNQTFNEAIDLCNYYKKNPEIVKYDSEDIGELANNFSALEISAPFFSQLEIYKAQKKKGFKVSIDGHGADECHGGYTKDIKNYAIFFQNSLADLYQTIINIKGPEYLGKMIKGMGLAQNLTKFNIDISKFLQNQDALIVNKYVENNKIDLISDPLNEDLSKLVDFDLPFQIMYLEATYGHLQWLLNKWDKASMNSSVEIRSPFMDWEFFQYSLAIPAELKIGQGQNKSVLRKAFSNIVPQNVINKQLKQGLPHIDFTYNEKSLGIIEDTINQKDFIESSIWDGKKVLSDFKSKDNNEKDFNEMWKIISEYLLYKGYLNRKKEIKYNKNIKSNNFNLLN